MLASVMVATLALWTSEQLLRECFFRDGLASWGVMGRTRRRMSPIAFEGIRGFRPATSVCWASLSSASILALLAQSLSVGFFLSCDFAPGDFATFLPLQFLGLPPSLIRFSPITTPRSSTSPSAALRELQPKTEPRAQFGRTCSDFHPHHYWIHPDIL